MSQEECAEDEEQPNANFSRTSEVKARGGHEEHSERMREQNDDASQPAYSVSSWEALGFNHFSFWDDVSPHSLVRLIIDREAALPLERPSAALQGRASA